MDLKWNLTLLLLTIYCSHIWATGYSTTMQKPPNPLNGKHLRVIWVFKRGFRINIEENNC
jgi:hypothetical protein